MKLFFQIIFALSTSFVLIRCATTTEGGAVGVNRKQLLLIPVEQVDQASSEAFSQVKSEAASKGQLNKNPEQVARVNGIARRLIPHSGVFRKDAPGWAWETHVITSDQINAFCMPGGKIVFYSGIIDKLKLTDGEIAAIMGHEISHALREHSRERMSEQVLQQLGIGVLTSAGKVDPKYGGILAGAAMLAVTLPHGRNQETEADDLGLELMARAGFNPQEAVSLWKKMAASGGAKPPQFLSTHPADTQRIQKIESLLPKVMPLYQQAAK